MNAVRTVVLSFYRFQAIGPMCVHGAFLLLSLAECASQLPLIFLEGGLKFFVYESCYSSCSLRSILIDPHARSQLLSVIRARSLCRGVSDRRFLRGCAILLKGCRDGRLRPDGCSNALVSSGRTLRSPAASMDRHRRTWRRVSFYNLHSQCVFMMGATPTQSHLSSRPSLAPADAGISRFGFSCGHSPRAPL